MGQKRRRITPENIFIKHQYKSILYLLIEFQNEEFQGKTGFKHVQFRYVLEKGYTESDKPQVRNNVNRLKTFFGGRLDALIRDGRVVRECIPSKQALTKILNKLKQPPINAIEKTRGLDGRYSINQFFRNEGMRIQNIGIINDVYNKQILSFVNPQWIFKQVCYGFSVNLFEHFNESEKIELNNFFAEISSIQEKIQKLKNYKIYEIWEEKINNFLNETTNQSITELLESNHGKHNEFSSSKANDIRRLLFDELRRTVVFSALAEQVAHGRVLKQTPKTELFSDTIHDLLNDKSNKRYKLKQLDIEELAVFIKNNVDFFINEVTPTFLAFSSFAATEHPLFEKVGWPK